MLKCAKNNDELGLSTSIDLKQPIGLLLLVVTSGQVDTIMG